MSREEHDAMAAAGRVLPTVEGMDMKPVTAPPAPNAFRAAVRGSGFVEFDVIDAQTSPGGRANWLIIYGPKSALGRLAAGRGLTVEELPRVQNVVITETN